MEQVFKLYHLYNFITVQRIITSVELQVATCLNFKKARSSLLFIKDELMIPDSNAVFGGPPCVQSVQKQRCVFSDILCKFDLNR